MTTLSSTQRRILLVVPKLVRDLNGHALIAYHLQNSFGHDVRLYTGPETERIFLDYAPDALVLDFLGWDEREAEALLAKQVGAKVFVLPTAGVFPDQDGFLKAIGQPTGAYRLIDCYLSWGEYAANAILERKLIPRERVEVVGCPRFDFYANPRLAALGDREAFLCDLGIRNPGAPLVLWCTSTCEYNNLERDPERYVTCMLKSGAGAESYLRQIVADQREQLHAHSELVLELAARHPEWNVLVKIHPLEHRDFYFHWARGSSNIFIAPNRPVHQFLFHCDVLLQRGCTTSTEAWMLGKPVLELEMGRFEIAWSSDEQTAGNEAVYSISEAEEAIGTYLNGRGVPEALQKRRDAFLRKFYYRVDGQASMRCAARIDGEVTGSRYSDKQQLATRALTQAAGLRKAQEQTRTPLGRAKHLLGMGQHRTLRPWKRAFWRRTEKITPRMIKDLYQRYDQAFKPATETVPLNGSPTLLND